MSFFDYRTMYSVLCCAEAWVIGFIVSVGITGCATNKTAVDTPELHDQWKLVNLTMETRDRLNWIGMRVSGWEIKKGGSALVLQDGQLTVFTPDAKNETIKELAIAIDAILETIAAEYRNGHHVNAFTYRESRSQNLKAHKQSLSLEFTANP